MKARTESAIFLIAITMCFSVGCYFEVNKKATADDAYTSWYKQGHPDIPIENITIPAKHRFSFLESSMHTVALMWFGFSVFSSLLFLYDVFVERKKGK